MAHQVSYDNGVGGLYCATCGQSGQFSAECAPIASREAKRLAATAEQEANRLAASQKELGWTLATNVFIAIIILVVLVSVSNGAVAWGDKTADKAVHSMDGGFGNASRSVSLVAKALAGGLAAMLGKSTFIGSFLHSVGSGIAGLLHKLRP